ncbi:uncharacterized protein LOC114325749 [Diabrotica virgifera virgifera]|uniref:Uncharacterized protein LOC114325749 n=1 Tax=Diabrotica virgifera virgifera TaxID=50390 RepID=A0A6P7F2X1_DIAVI|nr:uncharacterized protein LOC114325749 [Diabrotica virgifera virgifera]
MFSHIIKSFCSLVVLIALVQQSRADDLEHCDQVGGNKLVYNHKVEGTYIKLRIPEENFLENLINCYQILDLTGSSCKPQITEGGYSHNFMELLLENAKGEMMQYEIQVYTTVPTTENPTTMWNVL